MTNGDINLTIRLFHNETYIRIVSATLAITFIVAASILLLGNGMSTAYADTEKKETSIENDWEKDGGIRVLSIRQTSAGYMLDFRYKVINPEKAAAFIDRSNKPLLHVLKNGSILQVPVSSKIGPLRQSALSAKAGKNYFMFFANPGRMVKPGDKVKVNIGDFKSKILSVE